MLQEVRRIYETSSFQPSDRPFHKFECTCDMCIGYEQHLYVLVKAASMAFSAKVIVGFESRSTNGWLRRSSILPTSSCGS